MSCSHQSDSNEQEKKNDRLVCNDKVADTNATHHGLYPEGRIKAEMRLKRKLDIRIMPAIVLACILHYVDRSAVTSARLKGLQSDIRLTDIQYDTVIAIFYASYCPAQIISNMILNCTTRPSLYISACVGLWGLTTVLTGITKSYAGFLTCRIFIGLIQGSFLPGCTYLLSSWYTRKELSFRSAILFSGALISYAFGSLWAAGILGTMEDVLGITAWRWLFFIEGSITILIAFISTGLLPDYPNNTRWLTAEQRHLAEVRLAEDVGEADTDVGEVKIFEGLILALKDPKVYLFILLLFSEALGASFSNFFPTFTSTLGYSTTVTLLIAAPPWVVPAIIGPFNAWHADRTGERFFHLVIWWGVAIAGYIIALSTMATAPRYFSLYLMTLGYTGTMLSIVWVANTIPRPPSKRSVAIALVTGMGGIGNVVGSYIWKASWGPQYHQTMLITLCTCVFGTITAFIIRYLLIRENQRMERLEIDTMEQAQVKRIERAAELEGITFEEAVARRKRFRYLY